MKADIHSHLLPGIDDGARHVSESESILCQLREEGLTHLAFTPHFYPAHDSIDRLLSRREASARRLAESPGFGAFTPAFGAEVYLTEALFNHEGIARLCYEGTRFILTELEYGVPFGKGVERKLERLINDLSLVPVLAHIERFPYLLNSPELVAYLREMGCLCQMNLDSFGNVFMKRKMLRLAGEGMVDYLGQDLHRTSIDSRKKKKILSEIDRADPQFVARCDAYALETIFH
ncbi:MAG: hypothetical protein J6Z79_03450 [Clostridia bacterium]|nr:hypothetical protein [Clostridia bacterium]